MAAQLVVLGENVEEEGLHVVVQRLVVEEQLREQTQVLTVDLVRVPVDLRRKRSVREKSTWTDQIEPRWRTARERSPRRQTSPRAGRSRWLEDGTNRTSPANTSIKIDESAVCDLRFSATDVAFGNISAVCSAVQFGLVKFPLKNQTDCVAHKMRNVVVVFKRAQISFTFLSQNAKHRQDNSPNASAGYFYSSHT